MAGDVMFMKLQIARIGGTTVTAQPIYGYAAY